MQTTIPAYVYGLRATDSDRYFYVGSTKWPVCNRLSVHLADAKRGRCRNRHLASKIRQLDGRVVADTLCETNQAERFIEEERWIAQLLSESHPLCNIQLTPTIYQTYTPTEFGGRNLQTKIFGILLNPNRPRTTNHCQSDLEIADMWERLAVRTLRTMMRRWPQELIASLLAKESTNA